MPIESFPAEAVFQTFVNDFGMTKDGRRTRSPWQRDAVPDELLNAPFEHYIFNIGPIKQTINAGSMGQYTLLPPAEGHRYSEPLKIRKYVFDWADQGDYKQKAVMFEGATVAREWVTPNGEKGNTDLRNWGVFTTKHNPPSEADLKAAEDRLRVTLDALIARADALYADPKLRDQITEVYRIAARARHAERPWCADSKAMGRCEGCGRGVELDIAKCQCGAILDWAKARKMRLVTQAEFDEAIADGLAKAPSAPKRVDVTKA